MSGENEIQKSNTQKNIEIKTGIFDNQTGLTESTGRKSMGAPLEKQGKKSVSKENKIAELKREVPLKEIKRLPVMGIVRPMSAEELNELRSVYNEQDMLLHMAGLLKKLGIRDEDAPRDRNELVLLRTGFMEQVSIEKDGKVKDDYDWKKGVDEELKQHFDWLMEYFKVNDKSMEDLNQEDIVELPINEHDVSVKGLENIYEYQGVRTNNCYCCAASAMFNQFLSLKNKDKSQVQYVNQKDIRNFRPSIKKYQEEFDFYAKKEDYDDRIKEFDAFAGEGKTKVGNVFEVADFFQEKLKEHGAVLNKMVFVIPKLDSKEGNAEKDNIKTSNMKAVFMDKVAEVLKTGNVVNFLTTGGKSGHYVTITGIHGREIEYLDSDSSKNYNKVQRGHVDNFIRSLEDSSHQVEIEFISQMKAPKEMVKEFSSLNYSEENGYTLKEISEENVFNVGQTKGLAVKKQFADLGPGMDDISHTIYIPELKQNIQTEEIDDHEWVKKEYKEAKNGTQKEEVKKEETVVPYNPVNERRKEKKVKKPAREYTEEELEDQEEFRYRQILKENERQAREKRDNDTLALRGQLSAVYSEDKKEAKKQKKDRIAAIKAYEKNGDYASFGVSFDIRDVKINEADSAHMRKVKNALADYLGKRNEIFEKRNLREMTARSLKQKEDAHKQGDFLISNDTLGPGYISATEREVLGESYDILQEAIKDYVTERSSIFQTKRRKERLKQVLKLKDQLLLDDARFKLSEYQRELTRTVDDKYNFSKVEGIKDVRKALMPTWQHCIDIGHTIDIHNMEYDERRKRQKAMGTLPGIGTRMKEYIGTASLNNIMRLGMGYNAIGGLVDRTLGAATMIAANTLELAGKAIKLPFKILSSVFNFGSKYIFRSKKRWRMDYSLLTGWKNLDDGRKIFRRYLKGAFILPTAVAETLGRGIPYIFGKRFKGGVYKRTTKWTKDILQDVGNVFGSLVSKKYEITQRGIEDTKVAGGYVFENNELRYYKDYSPEGEDEDDDAQEEETSPELEAELEKIGDIYKDSGIPKEDLNHIVEAATVKDKIRRQGNAALPQDIMDKMVSRGYKFPGVDKRGFAYLLRPVNVDKNGEPISEEDRRNRELNVRDYNGYESRKLSDRAEHLNYFGHQIFKNLFTSKQLNNPKYIRAHKEQAIRLSTFLHYFDDHVGDHWKFYLTQADKKVRALMFMLKSSYYSFSAQQKISFALYGYGYGNASMGSSSQMGSTLGYSNGMNYKKLKAFNEGLAKKSYLEAQSYVLMGNSAVTSKLDPFSGEGKKMVDGAVDNDTNMLGDMVFSKARKCLFEQNGIRFNGGNIDVRPLLKITDSKMDELIANQENEAYIERMMGLIGTYMTSYDDKVSNADGIIDDL